MVAQNDVECIYPHMVLTRGFLQTLSCVCVCLSVRLSAVYKTRQNIFHKAWFFSKKKKTFFLECSRTFFFRKKFQKFQNSRFVVSDLKVLKNLFFSKKSYFHRSILKSRSPTSEILKSSDFGKKIQISKTSKFSFRIFLT